MNPFVVYILLCAASTAPGDCNTRSAIDVVLGPEARNEVMCGLEAQEMFAKTSLNHRQGCHLTNVGVPLITKLQCVCG